MHSFVAQLFDNSPIGVVIVDCNDVILKVNKGFITLFEFGEDELLNKVNTLIVPEHLKVESESIFNKSLKGETVEIESLRQTKNGELKHVRIFGVPIFIAQEIVGYYYIYLDISELQTALNSLYEEKEKLDIILDSIGDGVIATNPQGDLLLMNNIAQEQLGQALKEVKGKSINDVFCNLHHPELTTKNTLSELLQKITTPTPLRDGFTYFHESTNRIISVDGIVSPIKNIQNELFGFVIVFRDTTDKRRIEEERQKNAKLESIGILAGGIAHDFNNILTAILGNISLVNAINGNKNPKIAERLIEAEKASLRAKELTAQLLTYSKGGEPVKGSTSINDLLVSVAQHSITQPKIKLSIDIEDNLMSAEIDAGQMSQAFGNLLLNAQQAMPNGGKVTVKAENYTNDDPQNKIIPLGKYIKITISDTGKGISKDSLSKIFDPFFTTKAEGSGLGLSTSHLVIRKHNGHIFVDSVLGEGTSFTIYLPVCDKKTNNDFQASTEPTGKKRILVMDDDLLLTEVIEEMITVIGYEVTITNEGEECIKKYKEGKESGKPFDLVILDLTVPGGMGGKEAVEKLLEYDPEAVCIVSSGYSEDPVMAEYRKYGFKAVLSKPYSLTMLRNTLNYVFNK